VTKNLGIDGDVSPEISGVATGAIIEEGSDSGSSDPGSDEDSDQGSDRNSGDESEASDARDKQSVSGSEKSVSILSEVGGDDYQCANCRRDMERDDVFYNDLHDKLAGNRRFILAVRVVARRILAYIERARYKKLRKALVLIQSCIRRRKAKKWLFYLRRNQISVVIFYFLDLPLGLLKTDILCVTCIDTMKHGRQLFRFDKKVEDVEKHNEAYFVPGMNAMMTVIISILRLDEHSAGTIYNILAQAQLSVRDGDYTEKRSYNMSLSRNIVWTPTDPKGDYHYHIEKVRPPPAGKKGSKGGGDEKKSCSSTLEDTKSANMADAKAEAGLANLTLSAKEETNEAKSHSKRSSHHPAIQPVAEAKPTTSAPADLYEQAVALSNQKVRMMYQPLNPISSTCLLVSGPPLEDLRKPAETDLRLLNRKQEDSLKMKNMVEGRTTLWWLVLCRLKLYFFQYHGDPKPRLIADISHATCEVDQTYLQKTVVSIKHADKRSWLVEFEDFKAALRFEFAVSETQEAAKREGGSIFMKSSELKQKFNFGHGGHIY
jgi:hypothetical protein